MSRLKKQVNSKQREGMDHRISLLTCLVVCCHDHFSKVFFKDDFVEIIPEESSTVLQDPLSLRGTISHTSWDEESDLDDDDDDDNMNADCPKVCISSSIIFY